MLLTATGDQFSVGGDLNEFLRERDHIHDHIREMEHHLRALKEDRDYERKDSEYDKDKYDMRCIYLNVTEAERALETKTTRDNLLIQQKSQI